MEVPSIMTTGLNAAFVLAPENLTRAEAAKRVRGQAGDSCAIGLAVFQIRTLPKFPRVSGWEGL